MSERNLLMENDAIVRMEKEFPNRRLFGKFNKVFVRGIVEKNFEYAYTASYERFYETTVSVERLSGTKDLIPVVVSTELMENLDKRNLRNQMVELTGEYRLTNIPINNGKRTLRLHVMSIKFVNDVDYDKNKNNEIYLEGYIQREPLCRMTPQGKVITELYLAVTSSQHAKDYIPCICWDRNALWSKNLKIGDRVRIFGRIQSREYFKKFSPDSELGEFKLAYEVSISRISKSEPINIYDI